MQQLEYGVQGSGAVPQWYALRTRHQHEKSVAQGLAAKGFEVFLPLYSAVHLWHDRTKQLFLPLFPGYLFLRAGLDQRAQVLTTPGIFHFVSTADRPIPIEQAEIESVRQFAHRSSRVEPHPFLKTGDWVRVTTGPLAELEGILTRWKGTFRLVLSVDLLQQSVSVEVDAASVERVTRRTNDLSTRYVC